MATTPIAPQLPLRPELLLQGGAAFDYLLTLLLAPAGWGKTPRLRDWMAAGPAPIAWVSLAANDNCEATFIKSVCTALAALALRIGLAPAALSTLAQSATSAGGMVDLINILADADTDFALVLDEYHSIVAPAVHRAVSLALDYPPPQMHLVIADRREPPLPLARLRARRQLLTLTPCAPHAI